MKHYLLSGVVGALVLCGSNAGAQVLTASTATTATSTSVEYEILGFDENEDIDALLKGAEAQKPDVPKVAEPPPPPTKMINVFGRRIDPARVAGAATEIKAEELEKFEYDDVQRILPKVGGVYVRDEDGQGLRPNIGLRGASSDRSAKIALMEDGVLLGPAPYSAPAAYYFPLTTRMEGIDVFKGPASILYGPFTVGGAINLKTVEIPFGTLASIDLAAGRFGYGKVHARAGYGDERVGLLLEGVRLQNNGFKQLDGGGDTGFDKNEWMLKGRWNSDPDAEFFHRMTVKLGWATENSRETYLGLTQEDFQKTPYRRYAASALDEMDWTRWQGQLGYDLNWDDKVTLEARLYQHRFERVWDRLAGFENVGLDAPAPSLRSIVVVGEELSTDNRLRILRGQMDSKDLLNLTGDAVGNLIIAGNGRSFVSQGIQVDGEWRSDKKNAQDKLLFSHTLRFGARFHNDRILRRHTATEYEMLRGTLVRTTDDVQVTTNNRGEAFATSAYLQSEWHLFNRLFVSGGARLEAIATNFEDLSANTGKTSEFRATLLPGLGVLYQVLNKHDDGAKLDVFGGVHRGFSPVAPGQPDEVKPESSWSYELGGRYEREGARLELVGFFSDYRNLLTQCTFSSSCLDGDLDRQFNSGAVNVYGLESQVGWQKNFGSLGIDLGGSYTLTLSRFRSNFVSGSPLLPDVRVGDELPYLPRHQLNLSAGITWSPVGLYLSYLFVDRLRDTAGQGSLNDSLTSDAQHIVDLTARWQISERNRLYFRIDNLLNRAQITSYRPFGARPSKPFSWQLGFRHEFRGP